MLAEGVAALDLMVVGLIKVNGLRTFFLPVDVFKHSHSPINQTMTKILLKGKENIKPLVYDRFYRFYKLVPCMFVYFQADAESRRNQLMRDMAQLRLQVMLNTGHLTVPIKGPLWIKLDKKRRAPGLVEG